jgi:hypothetical protein
LLTMSSISSMREVSAEGIVTYNKQKQLKDNMYTSQASKSLQYTKLNNHLQIVQVHAK